MCVSAQVSFAAGAVLLPAGLYCVWAAYRTRLASLPLAVVPLVFSFQQCCEGFVWTGLASEDCALVRTASLSYLAFALGFWPFWVPFSAAFFEDRARVRWGLLAAALLGLGLGCALYLPMALNADEWLRVEFVRHSVIYNPMGLPLFGFLPHEVWDAVYGSFVLVPFFLVSAGGRFAVFRLLLIVSAAVTFLVFRYAFVSVWCFFAALLSAQLCFVFSRISRE